MAEDRVQRRLAAILAADVVGYSRLMGKDESGTLNALNLHRAELIHPTVAEHRGRIVKLMGDGALVEFPSVVDAVECAVAVQCGMEERNSDVPDSKRITFRIGINLGDIIIEGDDIYGDGVNVAARLEGEADPGGVCISGDAYRQVNGKIDLAFEDMGERTLKNIVEPVRAYRWLSETGATVPRRGAEAALARSVGAGWQYWVATSKHPTCRLLNAQRCNWSHVRLWLKAAVSGCHQSRPVYTRKRTWNCRCPLFHFLRLLSGAKLTRFAMGVYVRF